MKNFFHEKKNKNNIVIIYIFYIDQFNKLLIILMNNKMKFDKNL